MHHLMHHAHWKSCMLACYSEVTMVRCKFQCIDRLWQAFNPPVRVDAILYAWICYAKSCRTQKTLVLDSSLLDTRTQSYLAALLILKTCSYLAMTCYIVFNLLFIKVRDR